MTVIQTQNLSKRFISKSEVVTAVDAVDLYVDEGELVILMGPSGSGKTTLLSILGCILAPNEGDLRVCGHSVVWNESVLPMYRGRFFGFVTQRSTLLRALTVWENVKIPLLIQGVPPHEIESRCRLALETVKLPHRANFSTSVLSGGEQQRVTIARAFAADPPILLCDEPTANLDSVNGRQIMDTLKALTIEHRKSVLLVTHDERLLAYADRVYHMNDGRVYLDNS